MCVCIHVHIRTCIYTRIYIHIHMSIYIDIYTYGSAKDELCAANVCVCVPASKSWDGYLWSCPSITGKWFNSISHRPQVPSIEGTLDKDQTAAWSPTPGSSPCNELVMGKVTTCTSGMITALCNIFRNNAGIITWKVPEYFGAEIRLH